MCILVWTSLAYASSSLVAAACATVPDKRVGAVVERRPVREALPTVTVPVIGARRQALADAADKGSAVPLTEFP